MAQAQALSQVAQALAPSIQEDSPQARPAIPDDLLEENIEKVVDTEDITEKQFVEQRERPEGGLVEPRGIGKLRASKGQEDMDAQDIERLKGGTGRTRRVTRREDIKGVVVIIRLLLFVARKECTTISFPTQALIIKGREDARLRAQEDMATSSKPSFRLPLTLLPTISEETNNRSMLLTLVRLNSLLHVISMYRGFKAVIHSRNGRKSTSNTKILSRSTQTPMENVLILTFLPTMMHM